MATQTQANPAARRAELQRAWPTPTTERGDKNARTNELKTRSSDKKRVGPAARSSPQGDEDASSFRGSAPCLCPVPLPRASASCLVPLPRASASCLVPGVRTSAPNRVVRHELKTTAQCGASLPTAPRAYTAAARAAQRRQGSAKKRKDPGLISGQQHRPPDYIEQKSASPQSPPRSAPSSA